MVGQLIPPFLVQNATYEVASGTFQQVEEINESTKNATLMGDDAVPL